MTPATNLGGLLLVATCVWLAADGAVSPGRAEDNAPLPEAPPYVLLPPDWPYPAFPTCSTPYGVCRYPQPFGPGTPCSCLAANGVWVGGLITVNPLYPIHPERPAPAPLPARPPQRRDK